MLMVDKRNSESKRTFEQRVLKKPQVKGPQKWNSCREEKWRLEDNIWEDSQGHQGNMGVDRFMGSLIKPFIQQVFEYLLSVRHHLLGARDTVVRKSRQF